MMLIAVLVFTFAAMLLVAPGCRDTSGEALREPSNVATPGAPVNQQATIDDLLQVERITTEGVSPGGSMLAWLKTGYPGSSELPVSNLFVTDLETSIDVQITDFSGEEIHNVQWLPVDETLSFISDAVPGDTGGEGVRQVWTWNRQGPGPAPVTSIEGGLLSFSWKDPGTIIYTAEDSNDSSREAGSSDPGGQAHPEDHTIQHTEYADTPVRLFELDLETGTSRRLTENDDLINWHSVSPDGRYVIYSSTLAAGGGIDSQYYGTIPVETFLLDTSAGIPERVFEEVALPAGGTWTPDSQTFYLLNVDSPGNHAQVYTIGMLEFDPFSRTEREVDIDWERGISSHDSLAATGEGFAVRLADGCNPRVAFYHRDGASWKRTLVEGVHSRNIWDFSLGPDGRTLCYVYSTAEAPPQGYVATVEGGTLSGEHPFAEVNHHLEDKVFARAESIQWKGALGQTIEGMLYYPAGYRPGEKYPLVTVLHGGPFSANYDGWGTGWERWVYPYQLLSYRGAFALSPNYHGSSDYGFEFGNSISGGNFYRYPLEDIFLGIDFLVERGMVDETRLGTTGWSNGSILSNALIAADNRFRAAVCGAGGAEWVTLWGECAFGDSIVTYYFGADPVTNPDTFKDPDLAPMYRAADVSTPVLMFLCEEDTSVPPSQTWATFRAIQKHSDAPVELFIFPGEGHVLARLSHQRRKMIEEQKWFDTYLFNE